MLQELQRFSTDERGQGIVEMLVIAGIAVLLAVTLYKGVIGKYLENETVAEILCLLQCALDPACTGC